ncbi:hypothetical protein Tco_1104330 [Tanacetum coccineum]
MEVPIYEGPPSPDYVPGPEEPEQAPPSPIYIPFVPEPVYPEFLPVDDEVFPAEEQPLPAADSPTHQSPGYIPESDPEEDLEEDDEEDPEEDPADYPADRGDDDDEHLAPAEPAADEIIYSQLDDARYDRALLRARFNMLESDSPFHRRTTVLMEEEARLSRAAWAQSMDTLISELLKADYRRQEAVSRDPKDRKSFKALMTELTETAEDLLKDPAVPELPEEGHRW